MSKTQHANEGIGADNWLYIASHALSLYADEGGALSVREGPAGLVVELVGVKMTDTRLHAALVGHAAADEEMPHGVYVH